MSFYEEFVEVIENKGFILVAFVGDKGFGKSNALLDFMYNILRLVKDFESDKESWDYVVKHIVFTIPDFMNLKHRDDLIRDKFGRVVIAGWDDFGLHNSGYAFQRGEGDEIGEFIEWFEAIRERLGICVLSVATYELIPPKLRKTGQVHLRFEFVGRGEAIIYRKEKKRNRLDKWYWLELGTIRFKKVPDWVYDKYLVLKHRAEEVKYQKMLMRKMNKALSIIEKMPEDWWQDDLKLMALGLKDIHGNWTELGKMVKEYIEGSNENSDFAVELANSEIEVNKAISHDLIAVALREEGYKGNDSEIPKIRRAFVKLIPLVLWWLKNNGTKKIPLSWYYDTRKRLELGEFGEVMN
jgi:hypothetical protein